MIRNFIPGVLACAFALGASEAQAALDGPIQTSSGLVQGVSGKAAGTEIFQGIPYAAPPVGDLRWKPTEPAAPWSGVRKADAFAPDCAHLAVPRRNDSQSEDCLYLNIWTPARAAADKLPVMVWIYGGGFVGGSTKDPRFDGEGLSRKGVILVSFGYRTGVLGFLTNPLLTAESPHHSSGNYGMLDMIAALKWVRENIARFGGDPDRVTIFGQSSGSESVNLLTATPLAKGLFQRAIGESGGSFGQRQPRTLAQAEATGVTYAQAFGSTLAGLRAATPDALIASANRGEFEPVVDGWFLPADVHHIYASGHQNDVPTLIGSNADETQLNPKTTREAHMARVQTIFANHADEVLSLYPAPDDASAPMAAKALGTMLLGDFNTASWAAGQTGSGRSAVYQYRFTFAPPPFAPPGAPLSTGSPHGGEIPYAFNNLDAQDRPWTDRDRHMAEILSSYWTNFAKTGNPNGPGLPVWPSLKSAPDKVMDLDDPAHLIAKPNRANIDALERIFYGSNGLYP